MKFFPESLVPDPDKKINLSDKDLINKIISSLLKEDKKLRLVKQEIINFHQSHLGQVSVAYFEKNKKPTNVQFRKISMYDKDDFYSELQILNSFNAAINITDEGNIIKPKKLVGISIEVKHKRDGFAVGSQDTFHNNLAIEKKLYADANQYLHLYVKWIMKFL